LNLACRASIARIVATLAFALRFSWVDTVTNRTSKSRLWVLQGVVVLLSVVPRLSQCAEVGVDATLGRQWTTDGSVRVLYVAIPGATGIEGGLFQTFRLAVPVSRLGAVEFAPGVAVFNYKQEAGGGTQTSTTTQLALGVSYLRGKQLKDGSAPYVRLGLQARYHGFSEGSNTSQAGVLVGGGIRWRWGSIVGLRSELITARWFKGDYYSQWETQLRFGVSLFTD